MPSTKLEVHNLSCIAAISYQFPLYFPSGVHMCPYDTWFLEFTRAGLYPAGGPCPHQTFWPQPTTVQWYIVYNIIHQDAVSVLDGGHLNFEYCQGHLHHINDGKMHHGKSRGKIFVRGKCINFLDKIKNLLYWQLLRV